MKIHKVFLLVLVVFMANFPVVFNKFIGDDHLLIENNIFYSSWKNIPRLFEQGNIHLTRDFFSNNHDYGTGCVSYRPVLSLSYFLDYHFWGNKPFGYHLTNIIIHCLNCVLFYLIISSILGPTLESLFAAFLFGLHPVQSEAVAVIGYRADILAAFFVLNSFYFWIRFQSGNYAQVKYYAGSLVMYFFALFSKESSVMLPTVILLYDQIFSDSSSKLKQRKVYYAGFIPILVFYLYVYIFVFPNSSLSFQWIGGSIVNHFLAIAHIWYIYLINFIAPWTIKLLPGFYCPPTPAVFSFETLKMGLVFVIFGWVLIKLWRSYKIGAFFLLWFLVFYFPVSNLFPIANPMAFRYMYLPSAGLLTLFALFLYKILNSHFFMPYSRRLFSIFFMAIVLMGILCTLFINDRLKDDFDVGYTMIEYYPKASTGYVLLGEQYYIRSAFDTAKVYFEKAVHYGYNDPQIDMQLGICYFHLGKFKNAEQHFFNVISANPHYLDPYLILGNIYYIQKEYRKESRILEKALTLSPNEPAIHINLMKAYKYLQKTAG